MEEGQPAREVHDTYAFPPLLSDFDLYLMGEGTHYQKYEKMGAHPVVVDGVAGVQFGVWAPNAMRVSVVGDFNQWDGRTHPMRNRGPSGVWELFVPGLGGGRRLQVRNSARVRRASLIEKRSLRIPLGTSARTPARSSRAWTTTYGTIRAGSNGDRGMTGCPRRSPSTRSISVPGGA